MRLRKKAVVGRIGSKGELRVPMNVLEDFAKMHPDKAIVIRAEILPTEPSEKVRAYWFGYLIPEIQDAIMQVYGERFSKKSTDKWIRKQCPLFMDEQRVGGEWTTRIREFEELDPAEVNEAIEWLMQYASENLNLILDDAW